MQIVPVLAKTAFAVSRRGESAPACYSQTPILPSAWLLFCVFCNIAGWLLSACHQLNSAAYLALLLICIGVTLFTGRNFFSSTSLARQVLKSKRRYKRVFPLAFLILALMAILGGTSVSSRALIFLVGIGFNSEQHQSAFVGIGKADCQEPSRKVGGVITFNKP